MILDTAGEAASIEELGALVPREVAEEIDELVQSAGGSPIVGRRFRGGFTTSGVVATGKGPWVLVVEGDLICDHAQLWTYEYLPGLIYIKGKLSARTLSFGNGARLIVGGDVEVADALFGDYGDHNAVLSCRGAVSARAILLAHGAMVYARGKRGVTAVIYAPVGLYNFDVDITNEGESTGHEYFIPGVLDRFRDLDMGLATAAARAGTDVFKPGVYQSFKVRSRRT